MAAINLCKRLIDHTKCAFALIGEDDDSSCARVIAGHIKRKGLNEVRPRDIAKNSWAGCDTNQAKKVLKTLEQRGFVREMKVPSRPGRNAPVYEVNPNLSAMSDLSGASGLQKPRLLSAMSDCSATDNSSGAGIVDDAVKIFNPTRVEHPE